MLQSRRGFLIGAGSLLTTAFVKDAQSFIRAKGRPLLVPPKQVLQTLYWYDNFDDEGDTVSGGYLLSLGEWAMFPPPAPSWRELFIKEGIRHETEDELKSTGLEPGDLDTPVDARYWQQRFDIEDGPCAKAHLLLCDIDFGPDLETAKSPQLEFHSGSGAPFDNSLWVNAKDELSLSLLQARLIDLKMPIRVVEGGSR
jgi:hypothetical protein